MSFRKGLISVFLWAILCGMLHAQNSVKNPDPNRFRDEINSFVQWDSKNSYPSHSILFVGSSSIRFWKTHRGFPGLPVINRGFGGSHISDVLYFYNRVIGKYHPSIIVFYCGDNDIAANKPVSQVVNDYKVLIKRIEHDFPEIRFIYLPIKPSSSRWSYWPRMRETNRLIKAINQKDKRLFYIDTATPLIGTNGKPNDSLFRKDLLHLNARGYAIWNHLLADTLKQLYSRVPKN